MHTVYVENEFGHQFMIRMFSDDGLDNILDQFNIVRPKYIAEADFCEVDLMVVDLADPDTGFIVGQMTFNKNLL